MRLPISLALSVIASLTVAASDQQSRPVLGSEPRMRAVPVAIQPGDPQRRHVGALTYLGGVRLTSPDPAFGGFSAMRVEGDAFTLLSDGGNIVRFRMGTDFKPFDIVFGDLPAGPGTGWKKRHRDSESLAWDPATGKVWVGFENRNAIWRYDRDFVAAERQARPAAMARWDRGGGPESMVRLRSGRFVVISESSDPRGRPDARFLLVFAGDPTETRLPPKRFGYVPPADYDPTDVAELPDGRLLVLNRRFSVPGLFTAKLTLVDLREAAPGAVVTGVELATLERPLLHDNFEALALTREGAETILWIASDDNGEVWEQSLLLKFRLDLPEPAKTP
ncbi:esterase-like activity of phytase family protein [Sphingomonas sp. M1-B02]|uniref:esterase-like activity of phytase family protein n=1 Tax=Sphingomonas sp. M1-B02 TaxID=3114300 RepID=UPI00223F4810|nr:esterase-like activity of phytase family protein [Sphingomonas sp. S6-11]UZK65729.1 esterase-like activity of phytase family protein [Sphingomonas sp. S6-11]